MRRTGAGAPWSRGRRGREAAVIVAALALLAGCTAAEPEGATFVLPSTDVVECQEHQTVGPSDAYAGDADSDTVAMLELLRYWNEHGDKPYCDGEPPSDIDTSWLETVERLRGGAAG